MNKKMQYLEKVKRHLFQGSEVTNFIMIIKIKIYILSDLFPQIVISGYLQRK